MRIQSVTLPALIDIEALLCELEIFELSEWLGYADHRRILDEWFNSSEFGFLTSMVEDRRSRDQERYEYSDSVYMVQMPDSVLSFFRETFANGVNIFRLINRHAFRGIDVLFIRKQCDPDEPYAEIVICDGVITEIYEKGRRIPSEQLMLFVRKYAADIGFMLKDDRDGIEKVERE